MALWHRDEPQIDRNAVPLSRRTGIHGPAHGGGRAIRPARRIGRLPVVAIFCGAINGSRRAGLMATGRDGSRFVGMIAIVPVRMRGGMVVFMIVPVVMCVTVLVVMRVSVLVVMRVSVLVVMRPMIMSMIVLMVMNALARPRSA